ncbi:MAG: NUDIX domain-containing protein [archaeon]|jgi:8-oxo-dGTP diphosphatase
MKIATPVDLIILNKEQKTLLLRRAETEDSHTRKWSIAGGGIKKGETQHEALRREVKEELGCEITWFKPFKEFEYIMPDKIVRAMYYFGEIKGKIKISEEHSEFGWFSFEEIKDLDIAFNQKEILIEFFTFIKTHKI